MIDVEAVFQNELRSLLAALDIDINAVHHIIVEPETITVFSYHEDENGLRHLASDGSDGVASIVHTFRRGQVIS